MAFRCLKSVSGIVRTQYQQIARGLKIQASFTGLRVAAVWDHNNGFGYNLQGELVLVTPSAQG